MTQLLKYELRDGLQQVFGAAQQLAWVFRRTPEAMQLLFQRLPPTGLKINLDVLAKSRLTMISNDTTAAEEVTLPALPALPA